MIRASQPIISAALQAFDGLAEGGALSAEQVCQRLAAVGDSDTPERKAIKQLLGGASAGDPRSVAQLLDSWVGSKTAAATFTRNSGPVTTYQLV